MAAPEPDTPDSWTNLSSCKWIENPFPSPSGPPELIPDSEQSNSAPAFGEKDGSNEEKLASVLSTVQVSSPGSSDGGVDLSTRPA